MVTTVTVVTEEQLVLKMGGGKGEIGEITEKMGKIMGELEEIMGELGEITGELGE